ncbi:MAG: hypothetical protein AAGA77_06860 [Bacteroidota bacterium]
MAKQDNKSIFSEWLEKLQQESWQLELLISGLALFGIYESQDLLIELRMYVANNSEGTTRVTQNFFISILEVGWKIFFINLLVHVILRGLWIGAIGLRYVSQDIDYKALNYSQYFTDMLQNKVGEFDDFIERLERICSVLFAYTFLLFLLFFSISFFFFQIIFIASFTNEVSQTQALILSIIISLYLFIGLIVFIDFITLGIFKKIEERSISRIYGYIFTFYGWTTLTFLYRPLLYNFLDNRYTKRLFYFSIPYILIILIASNVFSNNNFSYYPPNSIIKNFGNTVDRMHYEDLRKEYMTEVDSKISKRRQNIPSIILNKYQNNEDYLKIFLKMASTDYMALQENTDISPYWKSGLNFTLFSSNEKKDPFYVKGNKELELEFDTLRANRRKLRSLRRNSKDSVEMNAFTIQIDSITTYISKKRDAFLKEAQKFEENKQEKIIQAFLDLVELQIDDVDIEEDLDCYFFEHPNNDEKGLMCLYPMDSLALGPHQIYFYKEVKRRTGKDRITNMKLPFYKVRNFN